MALRAYELSKLRYYFAVAELSSVEASEALMTQLDGVELGHSSMVFDLRFIPEDTRYNRVSTAWPNRSIELTVLNAFNSHTLNAVSKVGTFVISALRLDWITNPQTSW